MIKVPVIWQKRPHRRPARPASHGQFNGIRQVLPVCTHLIHASFGPSKSTTQMASRSVQPFLHSLRQSVFRRAGHVISPKIAPSHWAIWTPSNMWFFRPTEFFIQMASRSVQPFLQGSHTMLLVCNYRLHLRMWYCKLPNNNKYHFLSQLTKVMFQLMLKGS